MPLIQAPTQLKILSRNQNMGPNQTGKSNCESQQKPQTVSVEEKQKQYEEARRRIMGEAPIKK